MLHEFSVIDGVKLLRIVGLAGTDQRRLGEWAADEIAKLQSIIRLVANCPEVMNAAPTDIEAILHPYRELHL